MLHDVRYVCSAPQAWREETLCTRSTAATTAFAWCATHQTTATAPLPQPTLPSATRAGDCTLTNVDSHSQCLRCTGKPSVLIFDNMRLYRGSQLLTTIQEAANKAGKQSEKVHALSQTQRTSPNYTHHTRSARQISRKLIMANLNTRRRKTINVSRALRTASAPVHYDADLPAKVRRRLTAFIARMRAHPRQICKPPKL